MTWLDEAVDRLYAAWSAAAESRRPPPEEARGPAAPDERFDRTVGYGVMQLLRYGQEWVWRRTETFEFTSATTVRRQMGVDFSLPRHEQPGARMQVERVRRMVDACREREVPVLVPLLTLEKQTLTNVDVFDEENRSLPLLTMEQNGLIAGNGLVSVALGVARTLKLDVMKETAWALASVARLPYEEAELLLACLRDGLDDHAERLGKYAPAPDAVDERSASHRELHDRATELRARAGAPDNAAQLLADDLLGGLASKLARDFIVLVPVHDDPYTRRVFKFAYEEFLAVRALDSGLTEAEWRAVRRRDKRLALAERCSWRPKRFTFDRIAVGTTRSHHVELIAPDNTDIVRGVFEAFIPPPEQPPALEPEPPVGDGAADPAPDETPAPDGGATAGPALGKPSDGDSTAVSSERADADRTEANESANQEDGPVEQLVAPDGPPRVAEPDARYRIDDENPRRGHMHLSALPANAEATAWVLLRASPTGFLNAAFAVTVFIAGIFFAGLTRMDNIDQADAAAAILLAVPTLLAAYIARPGEHDLVSMMLSGVRTMVALSGLVLFLGAAAIAVGYKVENGGKLDEIWAILRWPALVLAVGVAWSWLVVHWPNDAPRQARNWGRHVRPLVFIAAISGVVAAVLDFRDDCGFGAAWRHVAVPTAAALLGAAMLIRGWVGANGDAIRRRATDFGKRGRWPAVLLTLVTLGAAALDYRDDHSLGAAWEYLRWPAVPIALLALAAATSIWRQRGR